MHNSLNQGNSVIVRVMLRLMWACLCAYQQDLEKKVLCYQANYFVMDFKLGRSGTSITSAILVVSPLVSLMIDQVEKDLRRRKVKTSNITSGSDLAKPLLTGETSLWTACCSVHLKLWLYSLRAVCTAFTHVGGDSV